MIANLREEIAALQEDHKVELYELQNERDDLADQLDELRHQQQQQRQRSPGQDSAEEEEEKERGNDSSILVADRSATIVRRDEKIKELSEREATSQAALQQATAELQGAQAKADELAAQLQEAVGGREGVERDMALLKERLRLAEMRVEQEGEDASREMVALQHALEERMGAEVQSWQDQVTNWKLQHEKKAQACDELTTACQEWEAKCADLEFDMRGLEELVDEKEQVGPLVHSRESWMHY